MAAENLLLLDRSLTLPALNTAADNFSHVLSDGSRMAAENLLLLDRSLTLPALNTAADNFSHVLSDGSIQGQSG